MSSPAPHSLQKERESLTADIERIKLALQESEGDDSSEEEDALHVDSEWEPDEDDIADLENTDDGVSTSDQHVGEGDKSQYYVDRKTAGEGILSFDAESGELPSNLETCLGLNRAYQEMITENIKHIELVLVQNRERQAVLRAELEQQMSEKSLKPRRKQLTVYAKPYFKDAHGMIPPPNDDAKLRATSMQVDGYIKPASLWLASEIKTLREAVKADTIQSLVRPVMNKKEVEMEKYKVETDDEIRAELGQKIDDLQRKIIGIQSETDPTVLYGDLKHCDKVDWMKISVIDLDGTRSAVNCELAWKNALHPGINTSKWKPLEDQKLLGLASKHGCSLWEDIAEELDTNRTAFLCFQRYQTKVNPCLKTGKWTSEEDTFLLEVIEGCKEAGSIPWSQVAYYMDGRSREQCSERWDVLNPKFTKGKWTEKEDLRLIDAVQRFGTRDWWKITRFVGSRSSTQIRERWKNSLDLKIKFGEWSYEEDKALWLYVQTNGRGNWTRLAQQIPGRTDNGCLQRYKCLERWSKHEKTVGILPADVVDTKDEAFNASAIEESEKAEKVKKAKQDALRQAVKAVQDINDLAVPVGSTQLVQVSLTPLPALPLEKSKASLERLAMRKYQEDKRKDEIYAAKSAADRAAGIYVPRPLQNAKTSAFVHVLNRRVQLHNIIKDKVHQHIKKEHTSPTKVNELAEKDKPEKEQRAKHIVNNKMAELGQNPTIKEILNMTTKMKIKRKKKAGRKPRCDQPDFQVENEIAKLLRDRVTKKRKAGRPRKFLVQDTVKGINPVKHKERSLETVAKITKLLLAALNVDVDSAVGTAESERRKRLMHPGYDPSVVAPKPISKIVKNKIQLAEERANTINVEHDIFALETAIGEKIGDSYPSDSVSPASINHSSISHSGASSINHSGASSTNYSGASSINHSGASSINHSGTSSSRPLPRMGDTLKRPGLLNGSVGGFRNGSDSPQPLDLSPRKQMDATTETFRGYRTAPAPPSRPKRVLQGPMAVKAYGMPPLPPSCSTLNAFKQLLLKRRSLIKIAGKYSSAGSLKQKTADGSPAKSSKDSTGGKTKGGKSKKDTNSSSTGDEGSAPSSEPVEKVPKKTSTVTEEIIQINSEDIDPAVLPSSLSVGNMLDAKDFLRKHNVKAVVSVETPEAAPTSRSAGDMLLRRVRALHDYNQLKARFSSLFLWPALLSTVPVEEQTEKPAPKVQGRKGKKGGGKTRQYPNSRGKRYRSYVVMTKDKKEELKSSQKREVDCLDDTPEGSEPAAKRCHTDTEGKKRRGRPLKSTSAPVPPREPTVRSRRATRSKVNYKECLWQRSTSTPNMEDDAMETQSESQYGADGGCVNTVCTDPSTEDTPGALGATDTKLSINHLIANGTYVDILPVTGPLVDSMTVTSLSADPMTVTSLSGDPMTVTSLSADPMTVTSLSADPMTVTSLSADPMTVTSLSADISLPVYDTPPTILSTDPAPGPPGVGTCTIITPSSETSQGITSQGITLGTTPLDQGTSQGLSQGISSGVTPLTLDPASLQNVLSQVTSLLQQGSLQQMIAAGQVQVIASGDVPCSVGVPLVTSGLPLVPPQPEVDPGQPEVDPGQPTLTSERDIQDTEGDRNEIPLDYNENTSGSSKRLNEADVVNTE